MRTGRRSHQYFQTSMHFTCFVFYMICKSFFLQHKNIPYSYFRTSTHTSRNTSPPLWWIHLLLYYTRDVFIVHSDIYMTSYSHLIALNIRAAITIPMICTNAIPTLTAPITRIFSFTKSASLPLQPS